MICEDIKTAMIHSYLHTKRVRYTDTHTAARTHTLPHAHTTHNTHTVIWGSFYLLIISIPVIRFIHSRCFFLFQSYVLFILAAYFYSSRTFYSLIRMLINNFIHVFNFQMDSHSDPSTTGG